MRLVVIFGRAVDLALRFFPFGTPQFSRLVSAVRTRVFEEVASSDVPGLIFTQVAEHIMAAFSIRRLPPA